MLLSCSCCADRRGLRALGSVGNDRSAVGHLWLLHRLSGGDFLRLLLRLLLLTLCLLFCLLLFLVLLLLLSLLFLLLFLLTGFPVLLFLLLLVLSFTLICYLLCFRLLLLPFQLFCMREGQVNQIHYSRNGAWLVLQ